jgi:chloramphenicol O-acetyltransferase type B
VSFESKPPPPLEEVVSIGRHTYGEKFVISHAPGAEEKPRVVVGSFCSLAGGIRIQLGGEHHVDWVTTFPFHGGWGNEVNPAWGRGNIEIGNDVWVGSDVLILSGSKIGDGAAIAARTVVSGNVAPYSIVAGNPMRFMRWRFDEFQRAALLLIKWWEWDDARIKKAIPFLMANDIEKFIRLVNQGEL